MSTLVVSNLSLGAGGLPDGSIITSDLADLAVTSAKLADNSVVDAKVASGAISASKLDGAQSGSAPIFGARAWANFTGSGAVTLRDSGNVSSISDLGTGYYRINFATAMPSANFSGIAFATGTSPPNYFRLTGAGNLTTSFAFTTSNSGTTSTDCPIASVAIFI